MREIILTSPEIADLITGCKLVEKDIQITYLSLITEEKRSVRAKNRLEQVIKYTNLQIKEIEKLESEVIKN